MWLGACNFYSESQRGFTLQVLLTQIISQEPLCGESKRPLLLQLLRRLVAKQLEPQPSYFELSKVQGSCKVC